MNYAAATWDAGVITQHQLDGYLGKSIGAICQNGYVSTTENHSAHFVSHLLGYTFGVTCQMMGNGRAPAATLRVWDLFPKCKSVGVWSLRPASLSTCLVFITRTSNVNLAAKAMSAAPRTHIGVYMNGFIWHYSNSRQQVVKETVSQFKHHYPAPDNAMFYGSLP
jgi:hypothetical protein